MNYSSAVVASRYRGVQMKTASPVQIVVMLYEGAIRFASEADEAMGKGDRARAGERIGRTMRIIDEFIATLDPTPDPEWADNVLALYGFCKHKLFEANMKQDRAALADVIKVLSPLRDAWKTVASQQV
jgi:flagellar protein FliS